MPLPELRVILERAGLSVRWQEDWSAAHGAAADSLIQAFAVDEAVIAAGIGARALDELVTAHRLWSDWLKSGRVRKFAILGEKVPLP
jgi:hypothetical protein